MNLDHVFVCGNPALDFAATLRARRTVRFEMFATPDRLNAWYVESGLVDAVSPVQEADVEQATTVRKPCTGWSPPGGSARSATGRR